MFILRLAVIFLLIATIENVRVDSPHKLDHSHDKSADSKPISMTKIMHLTPEKYNISQARKQTKSTLEERSTLSNGRYGYQPLVTEQSTTNQQVSQPPALFSHSVLHLEPWIRTQLLSCRYRKRRFVNREVITPESKEEDEIQMNDYDVKNLIVQKECDHIGRSKDVVFDGHQQGVDEIRYFHDIFMRLAGPHALNLYGHIEHKPHLFEERFESQNGGNRFKGKVLWADKAGGYGEHHWDMAQGKLS